MDGVNELDAPLPNVLVDHVAARGELGKGIGYWLGNALLVDESRSPQQIAEAVDSGQLDMCALSQAEDGAIRARVTRECEARLAEIRGRFEGTLTVRKRLLIKATGKVVGTIRYGQIEIECGGQISGDVQAQPAAEHGEILADMPSVRVAS